MLDRCERCGANLALVGRVHRCVTKVPEPVGRLALRGELEPVLATAGADYARHWRGYIVGREERFAAPG